MFTLTALSAVRAYTTRECARRTTHLKVWCAALLVMALYGLLIGAPVGAGGCVVAAVSRWFYARRHIKPIAVPE